MGFYLYISNKDSAHCYPSNKPDSFVVNLEQDYCLKGNWKVAVTDITITLDFHDIVPEQLCLLLDICEPTFVRGHYKQILRRLNVENNNNIFHATFPHPYFVNVNVQAFKNIRVQLLDQDLVSPNLQGNIFFTLLFKKV